jgi:hypothetical protein
MENSQAACSIQARQQVGKIGKHQWEPDQRCDRGLFHRLAIMQHVHLLFFSNLIGFTGGELGSIVARCFHRLNQCTGVDLTADGCGVFCKINPGRNHTRNMAERVLDRGDTARADHSRNG